ncbi:MAG: hypothetical protein IK080_10440 [Clostridia bacterium]|nr:hypothetical protein [Clostridia bacterium]
MRNAKKLLSVLLALTLALGTAAAGVGGLPLRSSAAGTGKAIVLVTGGAADFIKGAQQSSVWFGNYMQSSADSKEPVKWRVLSNADGKLFLLADQNLDVVQYYEHETSITWENSTVRSWLNGDFCSAAFSDAEHAAIPEDTVVNDNNPYYGTAGGNDTTDQVFLLSIAEATTAAYGFPEGYDSADTRKATNTAFVSAGGHTGTNGMYANGAADYWWLRSPGDSSNCAAFVTNYGFVADGGNHVDDDNIAVRPALNIHLNAVLFTSAPAGGKAGSGLTAVSDYDGAEWKLTLLDESRSDFTASACRLGDKWVITYSGATTGENEKISAMIVNGSGEVT